MLIERKTDEWRVVLSDSTSPGRPVVMVQRKWFVQDGDLYSPADFGPPDNEWDEFVGVISGRPTFQKMKVEWRDLPTVGEEEAKKDTAKKSID